MRNGSGEFSGQKESLVQRPCDGRKGEYEDLREGQCRGTQVGPQGAGGPQEGQTAQGRVP